MIYESVSRLVSPLLISSPIQHLS